MVLKQFIFLRRDLPSFGRGALIAQACHASVAALHISRYILETTEYLSELDSMYKIILKINESDISDLVSTLKSHKLGYYIWKEQPENIVTSIATQPFDLQLYKELDEYFHKFKLF